MGKRAWPEGADASGERRHKRATPGCSRRARKMARNSRPERPDLVFVSLRWRQRGVVFAVVGPGPDFCI